jgi:hypothetical protein
MSKKPDASFIAYKILGAEHVKAATSLQISSSFEECLTIGFGIAHIPGGTDHEGFRLLLESIIADGMTIGAFDSKSGELVGVCFNKLHVSGVVYFYICKQRRMRRDVGDWRRRRRRLAKSSPRRFLTILVIFRLI